jgi:hypothetical protein
MRPSVVHRVAVRVWGRNSLEVRRLATAAVAEAVGQGYRLVGFRGRGLRTLAAVLEKEITIKEALRCGS